MSEFKFFVEVVRNGVAEQRTYLLREQKMCLCRRYSANAYWETPEQHEERGEPEGTEAYANYALFEIPANYTPETVLMPTDYFETYHDVLNFFLCLRAKIIRRIP